MLKSNLIPGEPVKVDGEEGLGIYIESRWANDPGELVARVRLHDGIQAWFPEKALTSTR